MAPSRIEIEMKSPSTNQTNQLRRLFDDACERLRLAEGVLNCLTEARRECEGQLQKLQKRDAIREVTGTSSIEEKIAETRRMVDSLRRVVEELRERLAREHSFATA